MGAFALITAAQELAKMVRAEYVNGDRRVKILGEHDFETPRPDGTRETGPEPFGARLPIRAYKPGPWLLFWDQSLP